MFPADSLPLTYYEDRAAAEQARRTAAPPPTSAPAKSTPHNLTPATQRPKLAHSQTSPYLQNAPPAVRPPLSRGHSSTSTSGGFLGTVYQGFVKANSTCNTPPTGGNYTPMRLHQLQKAKAQNQGVEADALKEALLEEKRRMLSERDNERLRERTRDADICTYPSW
ncbi:hypothetical protein MBLNU230_g0550t1 [Neophaeotheca triangularis]